MSPEPSARGRRKKLSISFEKWHGSDDSAGAPRAGCSERVDGESRSRPGAAAACSARSTNTKKTRTSRSTARPMSPSTPRRRRWRRSAAPASAWTRRCCSIARLCDRPYRSPVTQVRRVSRPWWRQGRRFVQIRLHVADVRKLPQSSPFAWSTYELTEKENLVVFKQTVGPSALRPGTLQKVRVDRRRARRLQAAPAEQDRLSQLPRSRDQSSRARSPAATSWRGSKRSPIGSTGGP